MKQKSGHGTRLLLWITLMVSAPLLLLFNVHLTTTTKTTTRTTAMTNGYYGISSYDQTFLPPVEKDYKQYTQRYNQHITSKGGGGGQGQGQGQRQAKVGRRKQILSANDGSSPTVSSFSSIQNKFSQYQSANTGNRRTASLESFRQDRRRQSQSQARQQSQVQQQQQSQQTVRKYSKVIYFVHVHKSAGSLICYHTKRNNITSNFQNNCNVQTDQRCCGYKDDMTTQIEYAKTTQYDFVAIEREMYHTMNIQYYDYITCLRDSKSRYYSHWKHLRGNIPPNGGRQSGGFGTASWLMNDNTPVNRPPKGSTFFIPRGTDILGTFSEWIAGQPDNWNTRIFCGPTCKALGKYQITREAFLLTLQRLEQFKHIVFVEDMKTSFNVMASSYGWLPHEDHMTRNKGRKNQHPNDITYNAHDWDPHMTALDDALYEFATRKFNKTTDPKELYKDFSNQHILEEYFIIAEDSKQHEHCTDYCCIPCTRY